MQILDQECLQILQPKWPGTAWPKRTENFISMVFATAHGRVRKRGLDWKPGNDCDIETLSVVRHQADLAIYPLPPFRLPRDSEAKLDITADQSLNEKHGISDLAR